MGCGIDGGTGSVNDKIGCCTGGGGKTKAGDDTRDVVLSLVIAALDDAADNCW